MQGMKSVYGFACVVSLVSGLLLKRLFVIFPLPVLGLIAPINNSVWESLKTCYWPFLFASALVSGQARALKDGYWRTVFAGVLAAAACFTGLFYLINGGFESSPPPVYWGIYLFSMYFGFLLSYRLFIQRRLGPGANNLILPVLLLGICLILFSFAAPDWPIFVDVTEISVQAG